MSVSRKRKKEVEEEGRRGFAKGCQKLRKWDLEENQQQEGRVVATNPTAAGVTLVPLEVELRFRAKADHFEEQPRLTPHPRYPRIIIVEPPSVPPRIIIVVPPSA